MTGFEAIAQVLRSSNRPLTNQEIKEQLKDKISIASVGVYLGSSVHHSRREELGIRKIRHGVWEFAKSSASKQASSSVPPSNRKGRRIQQVAFALEELVNTLEGKEKEAALGLCGELLEMVGISNFAGLQ